MRSILSMAIKDLTLMRRDWLGMFFIGLTLLACLLWWRGVLFQQRWLLWIFVFAVIGAVAANEAGWVSAETGRQPWIVWHLLKTSDAISTAVSAGAVLLSLIVFAVYYLVLFVLWVYVLARLLRAAPATGQAAA